MGQKYFFMTNTMITIATAAKDTTNATSAVTLPEAPAGGTSVGFAAWMQNVNGDAKRLTYLYKERKKENRLFSHLPGCDPGSRTAIQKDTGVNKIQRLRFNIL